MATCLVIFNYSSMTDRFYTYKSFKMSLDRMSLFIINDLVLIVFIAAFKKGEFNFL